MSLKYKAVLENSGQKVSVDVLANDDNEALDLVKRGIRGESVLYNASGKSLGALGWTVSTLVSPVTDENIWKEPMSQSAGGRKKLTKEKVVIGKKEKAVYVGPRGGRYVRANGKFVRV